AAVAARHGLDVMQTDYTFVARLQRGLLGSPAGGAADMERAHGKLRAPLADRLRPHDADSLAHVDLSAAAEVAPVTLDAPSLPRLAGQPRANLPPLKACLLDLGHLVLVDHLVGADQDLVVERIVDVLQRDPSEHAVAEPLDNLAA